MNNIKNISIKNYLAERGVTPSKETAKDSSYLSPLRNEKTPSFHVDHDKNLWFDFGIGEGGSIIDLVMRLDGCSVGEAFRKLEYDNYYMNNSQLMKIESSYSKERSSHIIESVGMIENPNLINYLKERKIDLEVANSYCREVHYSLNDKSYYAIGFENDKGGWELRNKFFKSSSAPKAITSDIDFGRDCYIFEGFMDLLSYKTMEKHRGVTTQLYDFVVLNSVSLLSEIVINYISCAGKIHTFLDNDAGGDRTRKKLESHFEDNLINRSTEYSECNDLNEYLMTKYVKPKLIQEPQLKPKSKLRLR